MLGVLVGCFNSDGLLYTSCRLKEGDCGPAGSELQGSITPRACFTPLGDGGSGYCAFICETNEDCEQTEELAATVCILPPAGKDEPAPRLCAISCADEPCPDSMSCIDFPDANDKIRPICTFNEGM